MSVTEADVAWAGSPIATSASLYRPARAEPAVAAEVSDVLLGLRRQAWWDQAVSDLRRGLQGRRVEPEVVNAALRWLASLPGGMPRPSIGVGDDGSVSLEWDRPGGVLHVMFDDIGGEVYFSSAERDGDEFEAPIDIAADKIRLALIAVAGS